MGIDKFGEVSNRFMDSTQRAKHRENFRKELKDGLIGMCIHIFRKCNDRNEPDCVFVWKVLALYGTQHDDKVARSINRSKFMAPKKMGTEEVRHFNSIMSKLPSEIPSGTCKALGNYLFRGEPIPNGTVKEEYPSFVIDLSVRGTIEESMLISGRANNSRDRKGISSTKFCQF